MKNLEILSKVEQFLKNLKTKQKLFIYTIPFFIALAVMITFIMPIQDEQMQTLHSEQANIEKNIKRKSSNNLRKETKEDKKTLLELKESTQKDKDSLNYLYAKLNNLHISTFDTKEWTATLDNMLKKSVALDISIDHIKNSDSEIKDLNKKITPKKYVEVIGKGNYENILQYVDFIENSQYLTQIKNIKIDKASGEDREVDFKMNFTIYGVNL